QNFYSGWVHEHNFGLVVNEDPVGRNFDKTPVTLLTFAQGGFCAVALRDVLHVRHKIEWFPRVIPHQAFAEMHPDEAVVFAQVPVFQLEELFSAFNQISRSGDACVQLIRMSDVLKPETEQLAFSIAEHLTEELIHVEKASARFRQRHAVRRESKGTAKEII